MPAPEFIMVHSAAPGFAYAVQAVVGQILLLKMCRMGSSA
jgi:hypothetical protein